MTTAAERREDLDFFFACCAEQDHENTLLTAERFTGAAYDLTTSDFAAWTDGVRLGWRSTKEEAAALVRDQVAREMDHVTIPT